MDTKLEPCPFCGKLDTLKLIDSTVDYPNDTDDLIMYQIVCSTATDGGCGASNGWKHTPEQAINNWNIRI